ncbi:XdhC family protein [Haloechinothrix sp. YIM 98757]|uniref:XdhC family protein n=1 Tax=Haloechinothrix aidingensis TaxID=2752311 RepID=A0A838ADF5_9PSEU|nr:XdhC family protein [Haloechinothrix aidingensis]MBA0127168.1 XdhC family protein [Haloechinothrix aidingensis]
MRDILQQIQPWYAGRNRFALATVIDTFHSAPRPPGAAMAVSSGGEVVGSVSGGCIEGAVYELAQEALETTQPTVQRYGVADDDAFAVGLTCGGTIDILVQPVDPASNTDLGALFDSIYAGQPVATATVVTTGASLGEEMVVRPDRVHGGFGDPHLDAAVVEDTLAMLEQGTNGIRHYGEHGERRRDDVAVFVHAFAPPPRMFVFGAIDFAAAVVKVGKFLGYHVTLCDARRVFATNKRFPEADEVVVSWPHQFLSDAVHGDLIDNRTVLCVLTHDHKFDIPLLELALRTRAGYIGALGSRRTHQQRLDQLRELGLSDAELARLSSPVGLNLRAHTPEETAISIAAEIIAKRGGADALPLSQTTGSIHGATGQRLSRTAG